MVREMKEKLVILGAGAYANTVKDVAEQLGYEIVAMLDDKLHGFELSTFTNYIGENVQFIPAFGNNSFRLSWLEEIAKAGGRIAVLIHPTAYVSPKAVVKEGTVILPKACINTDTVIERGCIINLGAIVDHGCVIEEGCHICLGAIIKADNRIKSCTKIEAGQIVERAVMI